MWLLLDFLDNPRICRMVYLGFCSYYLVIPKCVGKNSVITHSLLCYFKNVCFKL